MARKPDWMCNACWTAEGKTCPHRGKECDCGPSYKCRDCKQPSKVARKPRRGRLPPGKVSAYSPEKD